MKTTEEMRVAVLAYCETVCPDTYKPHIEIEGFVSIWRKLEWNLEPCFEITVSNETTVLGIDATNWELFYRLLGLSERDAVAAANSRAQKAIQACADYAQSVYVAKDLTISKLEAKNAALVAFVQKCATDPHEMIFISNDYGSGGELFPVVDYEMLQKEAQQLIAANEKGGVQG